MHRLNSASFSSSFYHYCGVMSTIARSSAYATICFPGSSNTYISASFRYMLNSLGAISDPCGIPTAGLYQISPNLYRYLFISSSSVLHALGVIIDFIIMTSLSLSTVLYASFRSTNITFASFLFLINSASLKCAVSVDFPLVNPCW